MRIDQQDFANNLATLGLSARECRGFETDAYGAMLGLIHFRSLTPRARHIWDLATMQSMQQSQPGPWTFRHAFFFQLRQLRLEAFFTGTDNASINNPNIASYPWCLLDPEFTYCYEQLTTGTLPQAPDVKQPGFLPGLHIGGDAEKVGAVGIAFASVIIKRYLTKAVPDIMDVFSKQAIPLAIAGAAAGLAKIAIDRMARADLKRRYDIDAKRRDYLRTRGASVYAGLATPPGGR